MSRNEILLVAAMTLFLVPAAAAEEPAVPPAEGGGAPAEKPAIDVESTAFLKAYDDARIKNSPALSGFSCEILMTLPDKRLPLGKLKVAYAWNAPSEEMVSTEEGGQLKKLFTENFTQIWRGITGELLTDFVAGCTVKFCREPDGVRLEASRGKKVTANLFFDDAMKKLLRVESLKGPRIVYSYAFEKLKEKFIVSVETVDNEKSEQGRFSVKYTRHREVSGFMLPTFITLARAKGDVNLDITYLTVNGKPALVAGQDLRDLKTKIIDFEKGWPKWDPLQKVTEIKKLTEEGGPQVAQILAKYLGDPEPMVRIEIARSLGTLRQNVAVPALIAAMDSNRKDKELEVFKEICRALGAISDPRAVEPLSKNIMGGKRGDGTWHEQAQARIDALGSIKHVAAVDELISLFGLCGGARGGGGYQHYRVMVSKSLRNLTGQDFRTQNEWRDWWGKNKNTFKFE